MGAVVASPSDAGRVPADRPVSRWHGEGGEIRTSTDPLDLQDLLQIAEGTEWSGFPEGGSIGHVHLQVGDTAEADFFYRDVLGLDIAARYPGASFYGSGGYHHQLAGNVWKSHRAGKRPERMAGLEAIEMSFAMPGRRGHRRPRRSRGPRMHRERTRLDPARPLGHRPHAEALKRRPYQWAGKGWLLATCAGQGREGRPCPPDLEHPQLDAARRQRRTDRGRPLQGRARSLPPPPRRADLRLSAVSIDHIKRGQYSIKALNPTGVARRSQTEQMMLGELAYHRSDRDAACAHSR